MGTGWNMGMAPYGDWERLASEAHYDAKTFARLCNLSIRQLERRFHREIGRTPQSWLDELRLRVAEDLLLAGRPVKSVAYDLGFKQSSHFCRRFKLHYSLTPSQFAAQRSEIVHVANG
jgi:transcriptional regulator GlxA family with amidase domain